MNLTIYLFISIPGNCPSLASQPVLLHGLCCRSRQRAHIVSPFPNDRFEGLRSPLQPLQVYLSIEEASCQRNAVLPRPDPHLCGVRLGELIVRFHQSYLVDAPHRLVVAGYHRYKIWV